MKRRKFLQRSGTAGIGLIVASVAATIGSTWVGGCSSSNSGDSDDEGDDDGALFSVDIASGHTHSFLIPQAILDAPPVGGFTDLTNNRSGHTHTVTLSQSDIQDIVASMAVAGNTSTDSGHPHSYIFA